MENVFFLQFYLSDFHLWRKNVGDQVCCCLHFSSRQLQKWRESKREINKFHALANSQEKRKRNMPGYYMTNDQLSVNQRTR